jgi:hypothetical protein
MPTPPTPRDWSVPITSEGRAGGIDYTDPAGTLHLEWEFAMSPVLAYTLPPTWPAWAKGREKEILERIGSEMIRQKAEGYKAVILSDDTIEIRKR